MRTASDLFRPVWFGSCLAGALLVLASGAAHSQNLSQMAEQASGYDAAWLAARANVDAAISRGEQARAGLLPQVGLQAQSQYGRTEISKPDMAITGPNHQLGLTASQPLYRPANRISFEQGQLGGNIARLQLDAASQDLLVRVAQAYFDVLAAQDTMRFVQAQKAAVQEQLAAAKRNFDVGSATITDSREAEARFDLVRAQEIAAANDLTVKKLALDNVVGTPGNQPWPLKQPVQLPALQPNQVTPWVDQAQSEQAQIRIAQLAVDNARLDTKKAETGHLPTVDLQASVGKQFYPKGSASMPNNGYNATQGTVGVVLNVPLFAGFSVQNRVKETLALETKAEADLDNARRTVAQTVRSAFFGVQSTASQVQALEAAEASSQLALDANRTGYEVGVRINIDVLNAQSQLFQTKRDLAQARYNTLLGQLKLKQSAGSLTLDDIRALDRMLGAPEAGAAADGSGSAAASAPAANKP
ncbi:TolC family outer membrane protein [Comamonas sp. J-3]|uniref:TolC family outer membrane protein n=1 Tax=Comamonas trifloxystrobinivorans TaxID=3350256 RepID=UPI0037271ECE